MRTRTTELGGWGRYPMVEAEVLGADRVEAAAAAVASGPVAVRGAGRAYGDSSLGQRVLDMSRLARFRAFEPARGVVWVDAGVTISDLLRVLAPQGWFPPVTPGTRFVTVGGAIASDVHGKNHHVAGAFSDHVESFELLTADGEVLEVSPVQHPELFRATCGGMGLTGVILSARVRMLAVRSNRIAVRTLKLANLAETVRAFEEHAGTTYSVAWVDCLSSGNSLGRSLLMLGEHADSGGLGNLIPANEKLSIPIELPAGALNPAVVRAFNALYYNRQRAPVRTATVPYVPYFYPLDAIANWNRLYGRGGFLQYQFVTALDAGVAPLAEVLRLVAESCLGSPLAVLKLFGAGNQNLLSFPTLGYTLTLDFPANARALELLDRLDDIVMASGGRIYLTKDARMSTETFRASYPRWEEFQAIRERYGAIGRFSTAQSRRLELF